MVEAVRPAASPCLGVKLPTTISATVRVVLGDDDVDLGDALRLSGVAVGAIALVVGGVDRDISDIAGERIGGGELGCSAFGSELEPIGRRASGFYRHRERDQR